MNARTLPVLETAARPAKLAHVVLRTTKLAEMTQWYCEALGARVVFHSPMSVGLTFDEEHHRLAFIAVPFEAPEPAADHVAASGMVSDDVDMSAINFRAFAGLEHIAFTFGSMEELLAQYRRLSGLGITPAYCINHGPTTSLYYADPQGNHVELQVDNMSMEHATDFMLSEKFLANPVGIPFDPEELIEQFESGVPVEAIAMHGWR